MRKSIATLVSTGMLVILGAPGLFLEQSLRWEQIDPRQVVGLLRLAAVVLLVLTLARLAFRITLKTRSRWEELALLVVLACGLNFLMQLSGGLRSPWQALYPLLAGLAAVAYPFVLVATLLAVILTLETSNWLVHEVGTAGDLLRLAGLVCGAAVSLAFMRSVERRRAARIEQELRKLDRGLEQLLPEEAEEDSPLSREGRRRGRVEHLRELDRRLSSILDLAREATGAHAVALLQVDRAEGIFHVRLARGASEDIASGESVPIPGGLLAGVLQEGQTLSVSEAERALPGLPWYRRQPRLGSLLVVPVGDGGTPAWVLTFDREEAGGFGPAGEELARGFARELSEWITSTRRIADLDALSGEFRRLYEASARLSEALRVEDILQQILRFCGEVSRFESCAICLVAEGEELFSVPVAEGYPEKIRGASFPIESPTWAGWILRAREEPLVIRFRRRTGMPLISAGERLASGGSFLGIPLRSKNRVSGALLLTRDGEVFSSNEVRLLRILCNQAAVAMENARVYERLEQMAATDALTGLFNRRFFEQALARELSRAERGASALALLLLDIDHFKQLNDTYGHAMGDLVLRKVAGILEGALRKGDVLARYGGEEFVILLPAASHKGARDFAERIRKSVAAAPIHPGGPRRKVTMSVGWSLFPEDAGSGEGLMDSADRALYFAKESGRNKAAGYHLLREKMEQP